MDVASCVIVITNADIAIIGITKTKCYSLRAIERVLACVAVRVLDCVLAKMRVVRVLLDCVRECAAAVHMLLRCYRLRVAWQCAC
jgi:hypothetical protein